MTAEGELLGIGVGPGEKGMISVRAWQALQQADEILVPRAKSAARSLAREALPDGGIPEDRFVEWEFQMDPDRSVLRSHYARLAQSVADSLRAGKTVAYLTLGDPSTYSTYAYLLTAVQETIPGLRSRTFPGVTSYSAVAAAADFSLGEGKERMLILPCPDDLTELQSVIENHDVVVLMKIGRRLPEVLELLRTMGIEDKCALGSHVGMDRQQIFRNLSQLTSDSGTGYLSTLLIRRQWKERRHR